MCPQPLSLATSQLSVEKRLKVLTPGHLEQIDAALESVGPFGQVWLIVIDGRLQFIHRVESQDLFANRREGFERR